MVAEREAPRTDATTAQLHYVWYSRPFPSTVRQMHVHVPNVCTAVKVSELLGF